ncbi:hypothetical protein NIES4106_33620 [Fischerella sp. NIES-4106]|jgi:hypothetical protein|nr:hypothetical protein NIES4106_33620 [Fischerella sp. NIES-4106]
MRIGGCWWLLKNSPRTKRENQNQSLLQGLYLYSARAEIALLHYSERINESHLMYSQKLRL